MVRKYLLFSLIIILYIFCFNAEGQNVSDSTARLNKQKTDYSKQLDIIDIAEGALHINLHFRRNSVREPGKVLLSFIPTSGFATEAGPVGAVFTNLSFFTSDPFNTNLSIVNAGLSLSIRDQFIASLITDVWLPDNRFDFLGDWRYYRYPSYTYGLGSNTSISNRDLIDYSYIKGYQELLWHYTSYDYFGFGYHIDYHFDIANKSAALNDFLSYNETSTRTTSSGVVAHYLYDSRRNINNPKHALYISAIFRENPTWLGSTSEWQSIQLEARRYFKVSPHKVLAFWTWNEFTFGGKVPYFDLPSTGWDTYAHTGRGYIQGRYRGPDMIYGEGELRFGITTNGFLGGVVFANAETVSSWPKINFVTVDPAVGTGIRVKFNKYSNVNVGLDVAMGVEGSKGIYLNLGEVF